MSWQYSRLDHLPAGAACLFCGRPLKSLKGIVIVDGDQEAYAGPNCAKKQLGNPEERLLDVARLAMLVVSEGDPEDPAPQAESRSNPAPKTGTQSTPRSGPERAPLPPLDSVVQYLRLRYEVMNGFRHQKSALLTEAYQAVQAGNLDEVLRKRVAGMMRSAADKQTVFSEKNIMKCIAMNHWLQEAIVNTPKERNDFLTRMLSVLRTRWSLTQGQLEGFNKWGASLRRRIHDFPHLDASTFDGVVVPDFMLAKRITDKTRGETSE